MPTHLPKNEFISHSADRGSEPVGHGGGYNGGHTSPVAESAAAKCAHPRSPAAADLSNSAMPNAESAAASKGPPVADATAAPLPATNHISEIFHYARKLMRCHQGFVLDEARFLAEVEEEPLFIRDGEHLRRWA